MNDEVSIDYTTWDWLPRAASEMEAYVLRLLEESGIKAHDVAARTKSIGSLQRKQQAKQYLDPMREITDIVAIRIITYSNTDRARVADLIRGRFMIDPGEDKNPGELRNDPRRRGYDCHHIVVSGQKDDVASDWIISGGKLARYLDEFGGLEIQIRTVAGHAWAEFEHARRYKGVQYQSVTPQDQETIDQLFGAASDARRALDETFVAIDRMLARPSADSSPGPFEPFGNEPKPGTDPQTELSASSLRTFLSQRFPNDAAPSSRGLQFGVELVRACEIETIEALELALESVDSELVIALMETTVPVTRVRRLDDELLARFEEEYISRTGGLGETATRAQQMEWRFDRLRGKARYKSYTLEGKDSPAEFDSRQMTATGMVRELAIWIAQNRGPELVTTLDPFSAADDLPRGARAKQIWTQQSDSIWMTMNLSREFAEAIMRALFRNLSDLELEIHKDGELIVRSQGISRIDQSAETYRRSGKAVW